jgi:hypothetical protein
VTVRLVILTIIPRRLLCDDEPRALVIRRTGVARNSRELAKRPAVDPQDEPSAEWGLHGSFPRAKIVGGVVSIILLVVFAFGPYQSRTQDLWLFGLALILLGMIVLQVLKRRNSWRR